MHMVQHCLLYEIVRVVLDVQMKYDSFMVGIPEHEGLQPGWRAMNFEWAFCAEPIV